MRRYLRSLGVVAVAMLLFGPVDGPKAQQNTGTSSRPPVLPDPLAPMGPEHGQAERDKMLKAVQEDRQKKLVSDTEKLLALATALHADVAKTDRNILSMDVIRRADEIERLAHSVKERMKG